jgi:hypothetical protein
MVSGVEIENIDTVTDLGLEVQRIAEIGGCSGRS